MCLAATPDVQPKGSLLQLHGTTQWGLSSMKTDLQGLWGRCAGRNKEDAATLVEGLSALQSRQHAEHSRASALEARVHKLEAQLAQPAPALPLAQVCCSDRARLPRWQSHRQR